MQVPAEQLQKLEIFKNLECLKRSTRCMELEITFDNKDDVEKYLQDELDKKLSEIAQFILSESQKNIVANNSIGATAQLLNKVTIDLATPLKKTITYEVPYADYVEYGTLPHRVSSKHLELWAQRKFGLSPEEAKRVAYLVSQKIAKEGVEARPFVRPAIEKAKQKFGSL